MDTRSAQDLINKLSDTSDGICLGWKNKCHIATSTFRQEAEDYLSKETSGSLACVEIYLNRELPRIDNFQGIIKIDELGVWYYDGDGHIDDQIWRQYLIPHNAIDCIITHQDS